MAQTRKFQGRARKIQRLPSGDVAYSYHETVVVMAKANGDIVLNSGGYRTATTKLAINQALCELGSSASVFQRAGKWYVNSSGDDVVCRDFSDGFTL